MDETTKNDKGSIYEISYLIASSVPEEKIVEDGNVLRQIVTDAGAAVIAEEASHRERLAYEMRKKTVSGSYEKYNEGYFGWIKFEVAPDKVEAIKKAFEKHESVLRVLLLGTVREDTYLGKRASQIAASFTTRNEIAVPRDEGKSEAKKETPIAPASIEEMDKSIDEMVKAVI